MKVWKDSLVAPVPGDHFVFGTPDGERIGYEGLHNVLETVIDDAREEDVLPDDERWISCHAARHTLNTNLLAAGVAPLLVQSFLGWSSTEARILTSSRKWNRKERDEEPRRGNLRLSDRFRCRS